MEEETMFGIKRRENKAIEEIKSKVDEILEEAVSVYDNSINIADRKAMFLADKCSEMSFVGQPNRMGVKGTIYGAFEDLVQELKDTPLADRVIDKKMLMAFRNALLDERLRDGGYLANSAYITISLL